MPNHGSSPHGLTKNEHLPYCWWLAKLLQWQSSLQQERKVCGSAVLCLSVTENSGRKRALSLPHPHHAAPAASQEARGLRAPLSDVGTAQRMQVLHRGCHCSPVASSGHQSDAIKKQQLEPGHLDNFIRPNALLSLLA